MSGWRSLRERAVAAVRERSREALRAAGRSARAALAWAWARRPSASRAAAAAVAATIAGVSAWAILEQARGPGRLPSSIDWAAARALVERDARPGDAVAVAPAWAERAREVLPASVAVLAQRRYAGEDLVGVRRVWVLSLPDAPRFGWDVEVDLVERAARSEAPARLGSLEVTRYDVAFPTLPLAFLPDRLGRGAVALGDRPCAATLDGRFRCGDGTVQVERTVREVDGVPRPCLAVSAAEPLDAPLAIEFPPLPLGRTLHGHAGAPGRSPAGAQLRVAVALGGEEVGAADVSLASWTPFRIDMTRVAGQARQLALVLTSPDPLTVCLDAMVLP
jgi:hypothetical protein